MLPQIGSNLYTLVQNGGAAQQDERDQGSSNNTSAPGRRKT